MARASGENFPVAILLLTPRQRRALLSIYGFARLVDELGDSVEGDRLEALRWLQCELHRAYEGTAGSVLMQALAETIREHELPIEPFCALIEANRRDQSVRRYQTWEQLQEYCALSANPVGQLVLCVFGLASPARIALSDKICTALQLIEHCQDVAEDHRNGRIYLPREDMDRFGCTEQHLRAARAGPELRQLIAFQVQRARTLLREGRPLLGTVRGRPRLALTGFIAGGSAALQAIEDAGCDVLAGPPRAGRGALAISFGSLLLRDGRADGTVPRHDGAPAAPDGRGVPMLGTAAGATSSLRPPVRSVGHRDTSAGPAVLQARSGGLIGARRRSRVERAHIRCAEVTKRAAANFYYGIALLPAGKRNAMCAVYAHARRIDDIGDGVLPRERKLQLLDVERSMLRELSPAGDDPVLIAIADAHRRFGLPLDALEDLIEGVRMDVLEVRYETFEDLVLYCRRVAGSIGRLSLSIFGSAQMPLATALADDLGVAMQLTNILRDLREDGERGRVYIPSEDLVRYHLHDSGAMGAAEMVRLAIEGAAAQERVVAGFGGGDVGQLFALMRFCALRAHAWFGRGLGLVPLLDRRSAACVMAMTGIYRRLLTEIQDHPDQALERRLSVPTRAKAWVALTSVLGHHDVPVRAIPERML